MEAEWNGEMMTEEEGRMMGLKESECTQMGVIMMQGTLGCTREAPADRACPVLPVGVDTNTPATKHYVNVTFKHWRKIQRFQLSQRLFLLS